MIFKGDKVHIIPLEREHLDLLRNWMNSQDIAVGLLRSLPVSEDTHERWFKNIDWVHNMVFAISESSNDSTVGNIGLAEVNYIHSRAKLWIFIAKKKYRRGGLAREAMNLVLNYAFYSLNLNKVYLEVAVHNQAAIKLYESCGFDFDGKLTAHYFNRGAYIDVYLMCLLRSRYDEINRRT